MSKKCQNCGFELADNMNFCPQCHAKYVAAPPQGVANGAAAPSGAPTSVPVASNASVPAGSDAGARFVQLAQVVLARPHRDSTNQIQVLRSSPNQLKLISAMDQYESWEAVFAGVLFFPCRYTLTMTVDFDAAGNPRNENFRLGAPTAISGWIMWVTGIILFVGFCISFLGMGLGILTLIILAVYAVIIPLNISFRKSALHKSLESVRQALPEQTKIIPPERSSFDFRGKTAAQISADFMARTGGEGGFVTDPNELAARVGAKRKLAEQLDPAECIFAVGNDKLYLLFTMRGVFVCDANILLVGFKGFRGPYPYQNVIGMTGNKFMGLNGQAVVCLEKDDYYRNIICVAGNPGNINTPVLDFIRGMQERD